MRRQDKYLSSSNLIQVRDLLLWQDVYMGEAGGGGGASQVIKDVISSQNGSQDGSDVGNELAEEMDKLQVGKKIIF